jgi:hypothetical protein
MRNKLTKICESFFAHSVEIPSNIGQAEVARRLHEI